MADKKRIVIRFDSAREYAMVQDAIKEFKKFKKLKGKNEVYLKLLKIGIANANQKMDNNLPKQESIISKEIKDLLTLTEAQMRLLFWVSMATKKPSMEELQKIDVSKLPLLDSIKKMI